MMIVTQYLQLINKAITRRILKMVWAWIQTVLMMTFDVMYAVHPLTGWTLYSVGRVVLVCNHMQINIRRALHNGNSRII